MDTLAPSTTIVWAPQAKQAKLISCLASEICFGGARGGGKMLALDTPIPTPDGWVLNGDIEPGDYVLGEDGLPVLVTDVSEIIYDEDAYRISFSDGTSIVAGASHLWKTMTRKERRASLKRSPAYMASRRETRPSRATGNNLRPHVAKANSERNHELLGIPTGENRTTRAIAESLMCKEETNHSILNHTPIQLEDADLVIPPYTLGAWLGDGSRSDGRICGIDPEIFTEIESEGLRVSHHALAVSHCVLGLATLLHSEGLMNDKHIPIKYLRGSYTQRLRLLCGLMDTDGWCEKDGSSKIALTNKRLFDGVVELVRTFGITVNVTKGYKSATNGSVGNSTLCWTATFITTIPVFCLPRKRARQKEVVHPRYGRRFIVAAENIGPRPMRCITVANMDGMYLAGEMFIPTHNSEGMIGLIYARAMQYGAAFKCLVLRRTLKGLMQFEDRMKQVFSSVHPIKDCWAESKRRWTFPNGASVWLNYCESDNDVQQYFGHAYTLVVVEELTQWENEETYLWLFSILRDPVVPCQLVSSTNPGGPGMKWVKRRFIDFAPPNKITKVRVENPKDKDNPFYKTRVFIPSFLEDNAYYKGTDYEASLLSLPERMRKMYLDGLWDVNEGQFFDEWDRKVHVCRAFNPPKDQGMRWTSMDWGNPAPYCIHWWWQNPEGKVYIYRELAPMNEKGEVGVKHHDTAREVAQRMREIESRMGEHITERWADLSIFDDGGGNSSIGLEFEKEGVFWQKAKKAKKEYSVQMLRKMMKIYNGQSQIQFMDNCRYTIAAIPAIQTDKNNTDLYDTKGDDHPLDSLLYGCRKDVLSSEEMLMMGKVTQNVTRTWGLGGWR